MAEAIQFEGISQSEFFERHGAPPRIGLCCWLELINRIIGRAQ